MLCGIHSGLVRETDGELFWVRASRRLNDHREGWEEMRQE